MILSSMFKKLITSFVLFAVFLTNMVLPTVASAQEWWAPTYEEFNTKVNDPSIPDSEIFGERYTHAQVWWVVYSLIALAFGTSTMSCAADASSQGNDLDIFEQCVENSTQASSGGDWGILALAEMTDQILYRSQPASGINYTASILNKLGVQTANAQEGGFGFNSLQPLQGIWAVSRNAAYALMTLAVIGLAFMIMFRTKISPQASVTVQSAIPRIIVGLLLITFSFAIAGFVIDLAYVIQGVIAALFSQSNLVEAEGANAVYLFNRMNDVTTGFMAYGMIIVIIFLVLGAAATVIGGLATGGAAAVPIMIASMIVLLVVLLLFLIAVLKVFWLMLRTYVMILFHIIALPFAALGYVALPSGNSFMQLLKSLVGHVSVFVTISVVVMLSHLIFWNMSTWSSVGCQGCITESITNPYQSSIGTFGGTLGVPAFSSVDTAAISVFIGLVILLMAPSVANNVRSMISTGRPAREGFSLMGAGAAATVGGLVGGAVGSGVSRVGGTRIEASVNRWLGKDKAGETSGSGVTKPPVA